MRTRMLTKMLLFSAIPDELKHIIGYETSYKGAMLIFNLFQYPSLNRRLLLVLFESFLKTLFPNNKFPELIKKLHSESTKLVTAQTTSSEKSNDVQMTTQDLQKSPEIVSHSPEIEKKVSKIHSPEIKEKPKAKVRKEHKSNFFLECLPQSNMISSPKSKKRKKSVESAIFYTDFEKEEDSVILPLGR
ncbi:sorting nexin-13 [Nephila pilipes]|uniref:Sorting nexin-13 n=1 Tax=Nephila pilipes TaxID=299642 RepID=A0A8X6IMY5_NEPPI|nr:sorting nexin-13 [Nephila pilipes]